MLRVIHPVVLLLLLAVRLVAVAAQGTFTTIDVPTFRWTTEPSGRVCSFWSPVSVLYACASSTGPSSTVSQNMTAATARAAAAASVHSRGKATRRAIASCR